jgi:flagellar hook assembly protein FlgD
MPQAPRATVSTGLKNLDTISLVVTNRHRDVGKYTAQDQSYALAQIANQNIAQNIVLSNNTSEYEIIQKPLDFVMIDENGKINDTIVVDRSAITTETNLLDYLKTIIDYDGFAIDTITKEADNTSVLSGSPKFEIKSSQRSIGDFIESGEYIAKVTVGDLIAKNYSINDREIKITLGDIIDGGRQITLTIERALITSISKKQIHNKKHGILFENNIVSQKAKMNIILPNNEKSVETKITIHDITGNVVFTRRYDNPSSAGNTIIWNLTNNAGRLVANGSYLVIAEVKSANGKVYMYSTKLGIKR